MDGKRKQKHKGKKKAKRRRKIGNVRPYEEARQALRSAPQKLCGREKERDEIIRFCTEALSKNQSASLYISGVPGAGKTATIMEDILPNIREYSVDKQAKPNIILVNCMNLKKPEDIYEEITSAFKHGSGVNATADAIEAYLTSKERKTMTILIVDEIDRLDVGEKRVLYSLFEWVTLKHSTLILIGIANALDMTERILPRLRQSGYSPNCLHFHPYDRQMLNKILQQRLESCKSNVFSNAALDFCAMKIAQQRGDVRQAIDVCHRAIDMAEIEYGENTGHNGSDCTAVLPVSVSHINQAARPAHAIIMLIKQLPLQQKKIMCAIALLATAGKSKVAVTPILRMVNSFEIGAKLTTPELSGLLEILKSQNMLDTHPDDIRAAMEGTPLHRLLA